jgi:hypothetical protein
MPRDAAVMMAVLPVTVLLCSITGVISGLYVYPVQGAGNVIGAGEQGFDDNKGTRK